MNTPAKSMQKMQFTGLLLLAFAVTAAMLGGCAATKQARKVETSGFLGDYSMLRKGEKGEALLVYKNPEADWPAYHKILLEPVTVWRRIESKTKEPPPEDMQRMADNLYKLLYKELSKDYEMVRTPGPRTMRIQAAITDVDKSSATLNVITTVIPIGLVISSAKNFISGKPSFVGESSAEVKITDARTGKLLVAGVDRRVGRKTFKGMSKSWDDANKIMELWAQTVQFRLCQWRGAANCLSPDKK